MTAALAPRRIALELTSPVQDKLEGYVRANRVLYDASVPFGGSMVGPQEFAGTRLALCGAGPSLNDETIRGVDHIFACNSALPHLIKQGVKVTGAVGIDQSPGLLKEWSDIPNHIPYYVASSCDPLLIRHLLDKGCQLRWFHNYCGFSAGEIDVYKKEWPHPMFMVGMGMTVVSRFAYVANWMGFDRIDVYGADCAFGANDQAHADGATATEAYDAPVLMEGKEYGKTYRTRPDMLRDAVMLVRLVRQAQGRIRLIGDTLPVQLLGKSEEYLDAVSRPLQPGEEPPPTALELHSHG